MTTCREISKLLYDYVEGALESSVSRQLAVHLADCPGCVASIKTYERTIDLSKDLRCEEIPQELQQKLRSFLKDKLSKPSFWAGLHARLTGSR